MREFCLVFCRIYHHLRGLNFVTCREVQLVCFLPRQQFTLYPTVWMSAYLPSTTEKAYDDNRIMSVFKITQKVVYRFGLDFTG